MMGSRRIHNFMGSLRMSRIRNNDIQPLDGNGNIVVSLTTYRKRFDIAYYSILSIIDQSVKPSIIELYVSESLEDLRSCSNLLSLKDYGVKIYTDCPNLLGHKKYIWALERHVNENVITIDDDVIYPRSTISSLLSQNKRFPRAVIARRVNKILYANGMVKPYNSWKYNYRETIPRPSRSLLATGVGAVLYPSKIMPNITFDTDLIQKYALCADDIWLKICETLNDVEVCWAPCLYPHPYSQEMEVNSGLASLNIIQGRNDTILRNLMKYFELEDSVFIDK